MTMSLISTVTVGAGGTNEIRFSSVPQSGTDLLIIASLREASASPYEQLVLYFNLSGVSYSTRVLRSNGASSDSSSSSGLAVMGFDRGITAATATANTFSNSYIYIPNYTGNLQKTVWADSVADNNSTTIGAVLGAGLWTGTAAITTVGIVAPASGFIQNSTVSLYTITKGSGGATITTA